MNRLEIPNGTVYGKLIVIGEGETITTPSGQVNRTIKCKCECGTVKDIRLLHLKRGRTVSCGCVLKTLNGESLTPIGRLYNGIRSRCRKNHSEHHLYYDKGIKMCSEWDNDFMAFKKFCIENGYRKGLQIDRIDGNKGYNPDNCRFVTAKVNCNNRENTIYVQYKGDSISLNLLLEKLKHPNKTSTVLARLKRGWDVEEAIFKKPAKNYSGRA